MNHPSRRDILKLAGLASTGLLTVPSSRLFKSELSLPDSIRLELFFDSTALAAMQSGFSENSMFADLRQALLSTDRDEERRFMREEVRYNDQLYDILRLSRLAENMAFLYLMTDDSDAADLAAESVRTIMKFERWDYFLEGGTKVVGIQRASSTANAVSLCCDWLGDRISDSERREWLEVLIERGLETTFLALFGMRYPDRVEGWTRDESSTYFEHRPGDRADLSRRHIIITSTNLKAVPAAALAIGGVACLKYFGSNTDIERWLEMATYSLGTFKKYFEPDGSYEEGISYGFYTATQLTQASTVLKRAGRADLEDLVNWPGYAEYFLNMVMPTNDDPYEIVNFGDNGNPKSGEAGKPRRSAVPFWIAARYRDGTAQTLGEELAGGHDIWSVVWYDGTVSKDPLPEGPQLWRSDLDWIVARSGFRPKDLVVAMRSGGPANHEHADRNSIIVKCFGEQLVTDPYRPPYSFSDPAWMMRTTAGHSSMLVDGVGHQYHDGREGTNPSDAAARILDSRLEKGCAIWTSEATDAYRLVNPDVGWIARTVVVRFDLPVILIVDRLDSTGKPLSLAARFFGYNLDGAGRIEADQGTFVIQRPSASAMVSSWSPSTIEESVGRLPIPEERAKQHPFAEVSTLSPSESQTIVTAITPSAGGGTLAGVTFEATDAGCRVSTEGETFEIDLTSQIPAIEIH